MPIIASWSPPSRRLPKVFLLTNGSVRVRLKDPGRYSQIRWHDVGREGHTERLSGKSKRTGHWETIGWRFRIEDLMTSHYHKEMFVSSLTQAGVPEEVAIGILSDLSRIWKLYKRGD